MAKVSPCAPVKILGAATAALLLQIFFPLFFGASASAQDITNLGGELTTDRPGRHAIQVYAPNVVDQDRILLQLAGFSVFHGFFSKADGLGPMYLSNSCGGCHINNGKGPTRFAGNTEISTTMVVKASLPGLNSDGSPRDLPGIGQQLSDHSLHGLANSKMSVVWIEELGRFADGTSYRLRRPSLRVKLNSARINPRTLRLSLRMTPPVIGPGLLEAVSEADIIAMSDPDDLNHDGISGKVHYVPNARTSTTAIGRFGFRASNPTVEQQSCGALVNDMGVTNPLFHPAAASPELGEDDLNKLVIYQKIAGVPRARNQDDAHVISGKEIFKNLGCDSCHVMTLHTGTYIDPELSNQEFHPFTDLLLHDMGPGLADKRAEFDAKGFEWKTTPLWGLGFAQSLSSHNVVYLHDGRARTVEEAILWHGGEAKTAQKKFRELKKSDRNDLIRFLKSL